MKRVAISLFAICLLPLASLPLMGQTTTTTTSSAEQLFLQIAKAFEGSTSVSSVVLSGEVESYSGSQQSSGQGTLTANADGSSNIALQLGSGERTETQDTFANGQGCTWSGSDGVVHTPRSAKLHAAGRLVSTASFAF